MVWPTNGAYLGKSEEQIYEIMGNPVRSGSVSPDEVQVVKGHAMSAKARLTCKSVKLIVLAFFKEIGMRISVFVVRSHHAIDIGSQVTNLEKEGGGLSASAENVDSRVTNLTENIDNLKKQKSLALIVARKLNKLLSGFMKNDILLPTEGTEYCILRAILMSAEGLVRGDTVAHNHGLLMLNSAASAEGKLPSCSTDVLIKKAEGIMEVFNESGVAGVIFNPGRDVH